MDLKKILAGEVTAAIHGVDAAMTARAEFVARFSKRSFSDAGDLPIITATDQLIVDIVKNLGFAKSNADVRRVAEQNGLRLVVEHAGDQKQLTLSSDVARQVLASVITEMLDGMAGDLYLKVGRKLARITTDA